MLVEPEVVELDPLAPVPPELAPLESDEVRAEVPPELELEKEVAPEPPPDDDAIELLELAQPVKNRKEAIEADLKVCIFGP